MINQTFGYFEGDTGRPLINMETVVNLIANTRTSKGLTVQCCVDNNLYPLGSTLKISPPLQAESPYWIYT